MTNEELEQYGYELTEYDGDCPDCNEYIEQGEFFFHSDGGEYPNDGDTRCRKCAEKEIQEKEGFYKWFSENIDQIRKEEENENYQ